MGGEQVTLSLSTEEPDFLSQIFYQISGGTPWRETRRNNLSGDSMPEWMSFWIVQMTCPSNRDQTKSNSILSFSERTLPNHGEGKPTRHHVNEVRNVIREGSILE